MPPKRVLITGISGLLGSNLACSWRDRHEVLGIYNSHPVSLKGVRTIQADLLEPGVIDRVVRDFRPDLLVHCAALAHLDACQENQVLARQMNTEMVARLRDALKKPGVKLVYISTDAVYAGRAGRHTEDEKVSPANIYSKTKHLGESEVLQYPGALVVRTAFYGWNIQSKRSFTESVISRLAARQPIRGFTDVMTSMIYTFDLADLLWKSADKDLQGIYNFGSVSSLSKFDFIQSLARTFGQDASLVRPASVDEFDLKAPRAKNLELDVSRLSLALNVKLPSMVDSIERFHKDHGRNGPLF